MRCVAGAVVIMSVGCGSPSEKTPRVTNNSWRATEAWRIEVAPPGPVFNFIAPLADGSALVTSTFDGTVSLGGRTFASHGDTDVLVHRISADGKFLASTQFGGLGFDLDGPIVTRGDRAYLALQSKGAITIAGSSFSGDDEKSVTVLVTLDRNGTPIAACSLDLDAIFTLRMVALRDRDFVVAADTSHDPKPIGALVRVDENCVPRWRSTLGTMRVSDLEAAGLDVMVSAVGEDWLGLWQIDATTGRVGAKHQLTKTRVDFKTDVGNLGAAQRLGDRDIALGITDGSAVLDGQGFTGGDDHPFFLTSSPQGASYVPLLDAAVRVAGSGLVRGTPFFAIEVYEGSKPPDVLPGMHLIAFGTKPQLLPLYEDGKPLRGNVTFSDQAAWIAGVCDRGSKVPCLAKVTVTAH